MTTTLYILAILALFLIGVNLLPNVGDYPAIQEGVLVIAGYMKAWNSFFPIDVLFSIVVIITLTEIAIWGFKAFRWVMHYLRGT